jgi:hypothetical protein
LKSKKRRKKEVIKGDIEKANELIDQRSALKPSLKTAQTKTAATPTADTIKNVDNMGDSLFNNDYSATTKCRCTISR